MSVLHVLTISTSDETVQLYYPVDELNGEEMISNSDVCRNFDMAEKIMHAKFAPQRSTTTPAPAVADEKDLGAPADTHALPEDTDLVCHALPFYGSSQHQQRRRSDRRAASIGWGLTPDQVEKESLAAKREWLGEDLRNSHERPVPPISLADERIFQRVVASLMFERPTEVNPKHVHIGSALTPGGGFGVVHKASYRGKLVAVRMLSGSRRGRHQQSLLALAAQSEYLQQIRSDYVVAVIGSRTVLPRAFMLMEYSELGSLGDVVHNQSVRAIDPVLKYILLRDAAKGVRHLHRHAGRHYNLRAANLMLWAGPLRVKVSDAKLRFEWIANESGEKRSHRPWFAPEVLIKLDPELAARSEGARLGMHAGTMFATAAMLQALSAQGTLLAARWPEPSALADTYSFAMVIFEILARAVPFRGSKEVGWLVTTLGERPRLKPDIAQDRANSELIQIMKSCWVEDPGKRPNFETIVEKFEALVETAQTELESSDDPTSTIPFLRGTATPLTCGFLECSGSCRRGVNGKQDS